MCCTTLPPEGSQVTTIHINCPHLMQFLRCTVLAKRIKAMTTAALSIVAGVVGANSVHEFVLAASNMTPDSLAMLRDEIGRMGLQQTHAPTV